MGFSSLAFNNITLLFCLSLILVSHPSSLYSPSVPFFLTPDSRHLSLLFTNKRNETLLHSHSHELTLLRMCMSYVNQSADVLQVVFVHGGVGCGQIQQVVVASLGTLQLGLLNSAVPLCTCAHTQA